MKLTLGQIADWIHAEGDFDSVERGALATRLIHAAIAAGELYLCGER